MDAKKYLLVLLILLCGCSTTKKLPEGEVLYTGIKELKIIAADSILLQADAVDQVESALKVKPNNSFLGSAKRRVPFPFGLWVYNSFKTNRKRGFKKWVFNTFGSDPILISVVDPQLRTKVAQTLMDDNGYFDGTVSYEVIPNKKNPRKAKVSYFATFPAPYTYSSVEFTGADTPADSVIDQIADQSLLKVGDPFNVNKLEDERKRISKHLRNNGFYYFAPDFISYVADSTSGKKRIALRILPKEDLPANYLKPWTIGHIGYQLNSSLGNQPNDTLQYNELSIAYWNRLDTRRKVLHRALAFHTGDWFSQEQEDKTKQRLGRLSSFRFIDMHYTIQDSINGGDSLSVNIEATYDLPIDGEIEFNVASKSNGQYGPGMVFTITRNNLFRGGEVLNAELYGAYEWQTGKGASNSKGGKLINSYELGASVNLTLPRLFAPFLLNRDFKYPATTMLKLNADLLNRAGFFKLLSLGGSGQYDFRTSPTSSHIFTPFSLTYSHLMSHTAEFDSIITQNPALALSFENQFIPAMAYTYLYDNSVYRNRRNHIWWQASIKQAGNIIYGVTSLMGDNQKHDRTIFGRKFSQFIKIESDFRNYHKLNERSTLVFRALFGISKGYLNSTIVPYNEQFFIGGANSIRAFAVRTLGPGNYHPAQYALYSYLDQTGTLKIEANLEYRIKLFGDLHGAAFIDTGNIWLIDKDIARPEGEFDLSRLGKDFALGTGIGLRYDITFLVFRFDVGVPLHAPYETGKSGYFNIPKIGSNLGYQLAIGYPF